MNFPIEVMDVYFLILYVMMLLVVVPQRVFQAFGLDSQHMHTVEYLLVWAGMVFVVYYIYRLSKYLFKKVMK